MIKVELTEERPASKDSLIKQSTQRSRSIVWSAPCCGHKCPACVKRGLKKLCEAVCTRSQCADPLPASVRCRKYTCHVVCGVNRDEPMFCCQHASETCVVQLGSLSRSLALSRSNFWSPFRFGFLFCFFFFSASFLLSQLRIQMLWQQMLLCFRVGINDNSLLFSPTYTICLKNRCAGTPANIEAF